MFETFGKRPMGNDLEKVNASPNYSNGTFQNQTETNMKLVGTSFGKMLWKFLNKPKNTRPFHTLPSVKTALKALRHDGPTVIWLGHSSYFVRINKVNLLVDPVMSGHASPFSFSTKSFPGTDIYGVEDFPPIDALIITHDHYDHLDYKTVAALRQRVGHVYTSLGVASHLEYWGYNRTMITELDWGQGATIADKMRLTAAPARHFSGRTFKRNQTLWSSFILKTKTHSLFLGGDSGFDEHFAAIGEKYGPFDLAILETGQYNPAWPLIHMTPEQAVEAARLLKADVMLPVHWGKFSLALHPWDEPPKRVKQKAAEIGQKITTPMIGEPVIIGSSYPNTEWWINS